MVEQQYTYCKVRKDLSEFMLSAPDSSRVNEPPHVPMPELSDQGGSIIHTPIFIHPEQDLGFFPIIPPRGLSGLAASLQGPHLPPTHQPKKQQGGRNCRLSFARPGGLSSPCSCPGTCKVAFFPIIPSLQIRYG